jgi:hypothetical protein
LKRRLGDLIKGAQSTIRVTFRVNDDTVGNC